MKSGGSELFVIETGPKRGHPPSNHRFILDGVFLDCPYRCSVARSVGLFWALFIRLSSVQALDIERSLGHLIRNSQ